MDDQEAWLRLKLIPGLGNAGIIRLLQAFHTPHAILHASTSVLSSIVSQPQASSMVNLQQKITPLVEHHQAWLTHSDNHLITLADEEYPQRLLDLPDPPALFFAKGKKSQLSTYAIAVIGSRNPTEQGIQHAREFSRALSQMSVSIVSGLALGIDAAAHEGALQAVGKTIAVVGTGLDIVYPARNRALAHLIAQEGLIISEFVLGTAPKPAHFPSRNRLIAALSTGCLVVEAALQSGSLITARQALELGREVFAIPGSIHSPLSKGCHALIKSGAKLVEGVEDIFNELHLAFKPRVQEDKGVGEGLNTEHTTVLARMGYDPVSVDELTTRMGERVDKLAAILLLLEVEGNVVCLSDGRYQRVVR